MDQRIGRANDLVRLGKSKPVNNALSKRSFPRAQIPNQKDASLRWQRTSNRPSELNGVLVGRCAKTFWLLAPGSWLHLLHVPSFTVGVRCRLSQPSPDRQGGDVCIRASLSANSSATPSPTGTYPSTPPPRAPPRAHAATPPLEPL